MEFSHILIELEQGRLRAAHKREGIWQADIQVKAAILEAFRQGRLKQYEGGFIDKDTLPQRQFILSDGVRLVPGGSSVRHGAYLAPNIVVMPPSFINVGAYIDEGTMIDSHVLIGSCAQIGRRVHVSAGVQIGGVLEPVGQRPVIIEDDCFIGAGAIIVEGLQISEGAVIAPGTVLSKSVPIFDCVHERKLDIDEPIPKNAVLVPGSRSPKSPTPFTKSLGLKFNCALIVKYKDQKTKDSLVLEDLLRD